MKTNSSKLLEAIEIHTLPGQPTALCIIWLHGLGADGHDFEQIVDELPISKQKNIKFIFPHAPMRPITINNGYVMRGWYDIAGFDLANRVDSTGLTASCQLINALIEHEVNNGLEYSQILLAGFSQGGVVALTAGMQYPKKLGGIIALSCYLPNAATTLKNAKPPLPIFMAHGTQDPVVATPLGEQARKDITQAGFKVDWHSYSMGHSVCAEEIIDINRWIESRIEQ